MNRETIARVAHAINRAYCQSLGDDSQPDWDKAPKWQRQSALNGVDMHLANPQATPEQSHENWLKQKQAEGWTYGEVKDPEAKTHPCCLPYDELPPEQKAKDFLFRSVVHELKEMPEASSIAEAVGQGVAIRYIGKRVFLDNMYHSDLSFEPQQVRALPSVLAARFLRHKDLFAKADERPEQDDTAERLSESEARSKQVLDEETEVIDLIDSVNQMDKASLAHLALSKYNHKFKANTPVPAMRRAVVNYIHQYGLV